MIPRQLLELIHLAVSVCSIPPPPLPLPDLLEGEDYAMRLGDIEGELAVLIISLLGVILPPLPLNLTLRQRMEPELGAWWGRDVFEQWRHHEYEFWLAVGETPTSFEEVIRICAPSFPDVRRPGRLSITNRVLMTMVWLRSYPTHYLLSLVFDVSVTTVGEIVHQTWPILWQHFAPEVRWPTVDEWRRMRGGWPDIPFIVGAIDGTSHAIYRPSNEDQAEFYSGHRHRHCMHTVVIMTNQFRFAMVSSGYLGHANDSRCFQLLPNIGPMGPLHFPDDCYIVGDLAYPNRYPIVSPYTEREVRRGDRDRKREVNRMLRAKRIYVEHIIKHLKTFRVIGSLYRHPRHSVSRLTELCAGFSQRRVDLFDMAGSRL